MKDKQLKLNIDVNPEDVQKMRENFAYWEDNAGKFKTSNEVSWGDLNMMGLEVRALVEFIKDGQYVLDAGCSNGFTTFNIAKYKNIKVQAFDYSPLAIKLARIEQGDNDPAKRLVFNEGNILNINHSQNTFDTAYTIRVLINLPNWELQKRAIVEMHRVIKPGGLYLMSEAFSGSLQKLNALRALADLEPLKMHDFNVYLEESQTEEFVRNHFEIVAVKRFSSIYYVASRFMRYLTMRKGADDSFINEFNTYFIYFRETDQSGDFGIQKLYVLRKKTA